MTRKLFALGLLALAGALILVACGGGAATTPAAQAKLVSVSAAEFTFTPDAYSATVGEALTFNIKNDGTLDHNFAIFDGSGAELARLDTIGVGQTKALNFSPAGAGTFTIVCDVAGHREAGMEATLTVSQ